MGDNNHMLLDNKTVIVDKVRLPEVRTGSVSSLSLFSSAMMLVRLKQYHVHFTYGWTLKLQNHLLSGI